MPATPSTRILSAILLALGVILVVIAVTRDGNNTWLALLGAVCALGAVALGTLGKRRT